jgi:hypothetical protein
MAEFTVRIEGLEAALKKIDKSLWAGPLRTFFNRALVTVQGRARELAPVDTGLLRASIGYGSQGIYEIDSATPPMYAKIGTRVFYAPFQEFGFGNYAGRHYLKGGMEQSASDLQTFVDQMGTEIADAWSA